MARSVAILGGMGRRAGAALFSLVLAACSDTATSSVAPAMPSEPTTPSPDAQSILAKMSERYRTANTYSDQGTFRSEWTRRNGERGVDRAKFRTRWSKPGRLWFELEDESDDADDADDRIVVWTPRPGVTKRLFLGNVEDMESLDDALGALHGVSHGVTGLASRWLVDGGCRCSGKYELRATSACGRATCFELVASLSSGMHVTLYVSTEDHSLRRCVVRWMKDGKPGGEDTIEIEPTFDAPIDDAAFDLKVSSTPDPPAR